MKNILKKRWLLLVLIFVGGWAVGNWTGSEEPAKDHHDHTEAKGESIPEIWTCSMHPQIQQDGPGQCPLCGMDLIPLDNSMDSEESIPDEVPMSASAMKLAEIQTFIVQREKPEKEIYLLGKVKADERLKYSQAVHFPGRVEKLFVNFTGEKVVKGQKLATVYSTELITAQKELFEVLKDESRNQALVDASRNKLKQWKFTDEQIADLEKSGEVQNEVDILSDYTGYVIMRMVSEGDHFKEGQILFEITDLSHVWVLFEAYENDLPWINLGDKFEIELKSLPGKKFMGKVTFIDPFINPKTRVAYVRIELDNRTGQLKPDMFASGVLSAELPLSEDAILVPKSAILWTGKRAVVYVKLPNREHNSFLYREIILGEDAGDFYIVNEGLEEGEEIASNGVFKIDASAQLSGKKSMMNPTGGKIATGHNHGGMKMDQESDMKMEMEMKPKLNIDKSQIPDAFKSQIGGVVEGYLELKNKLVVDDANINREIKKMEESLSQVDMTLVREDAHNLWMKTLKIMEKDLEKMKESVNINEQRALFLTLSDALIDVSKQLGVQATDGQVLYLDFCPMANDNQGGYWLSEEKDIKNPYFGSAMLKCGEIKESFE